MQVEEPVLRVMERIEGDGVVLTVQGEVDMATVWTLESRLADACARNRAVTVDLRRVTFLDCAGLRLLLAQHAEGQARGCDVVFIQGPPAVRRLFELTGTLEALPFVELGAAPLAAVASASRGSAAATT
jgi:anti-sigma B factor antagonist